jgi:hypothetical protein
MTINQDRESESEPEPEDLDRLGVCIIHEEQMKKMLDLVWAAEVII